MNPRLGGHLAVIFVVTPDGAVTKATTSGTPELEDAGGARCIDKAILGIRFPPSGGATSRVLYPVRLTPP